MTQHTKNLLLAAALSLAFIGIWDHFYAFPQMDKQRAQVIEQQRESKIPKLGAPERAVEARRSRPSFEPARRRWPKALAFPSTPARSRGPSR